MGAENGGTGRIEVVGVVLHEAGAAGETVRHHLHRAHERRVLPVAFGAEAVAVRHQPLGGDAGQLLQAVQVFEGVGEAVEAAVVEEGAERQLDARRIAQRLVPVRHQFSRPGIRA